MTIKPLVRIATLLVLTAWVQAASVVARAAAQEPMVVPDFTMGATIQEGAQHDWNLGPTGLRGWIFCDRLVTKDARQIMITKVDTGSPAAGVFRVGDVILGVGGKPFSFDPRTEFGKAITVAESKVGAGKLAITRWRAGKTEEVASIYKCSEATVQQLLTTVISRNSCSNRDVSHWRRGCLSLTTPKWMLYPGH